MAAEGVPPATTTAPASDPMRQEYRALSEAEQAAVADAKSLGADFEALLDDCATFLGDVPELDLARQRIAEAVMWAVKGITS